jgi:hypothetical protein
VLSDRERGVLADIERNLVGSDPHLARRFQNLAYVRPRAALRSASIESRRIVNRRSMRDAGVAPCLLLIGGLLLIVVGAVAAALPVVGTGVVMTMLAFVLAMVGAAPRFGPGTATP